MKIRIFQTKNLRFLHIFSIFWKVKISWKLGKHPRKSWFCNLILTSNCEKRTSEGKVLLETDPNRFCTSFSTFLKNICVIFHHFLHKTIDFCWKSGNFSWKIENNMQICSVCIMIVHGNGVSHSCKISAKNLTFLHTFFIFSWKIHTFSPKINGFVKQMVKNNTNIFQKCWNTRAKSTGTSF